MFKEQVAEAPVLFGLEWKIKLLPYAILLKELAYLCLFVKIRPFYATSSCATILGNSSAPSSIPSWLLPHPLNQQASSV